MANEVYKEGREVVEQWTDHNGKRHSAKVVLHAQDVGDWHRVDGGRNVDSNLAWVLYYNKSTKKYALVFKGTEVTSVKDWKANIQQGVGITTQQYDQAIALTRRFQSRYKDNLELVGHSLGGGLASAVALATGLHATVFNPAGVNEDTAKKYGNDLSKARDLDKCVFCRR